MAAGGNIEEVAEAMNGPGEFPVTAWNWIRAGGAMSWRRVFAGRKDQVAPAREFVGALLADTSSAVDAAWITSELVTNALKYTRSASSGGWFGVDVTRGHLARIAVYDLGGGGVPHPVDEAPTDELAEHGWGLRGIGQLAVAMGVCGDPKAGHLVWAQLPLGDVHQVRRRVS